MQRALLAILLAGCSTLGDERLAGWPALRIVEHYVPHEEMRSRCAPYVRRASSPEACAVFDFERGECHLWFSADFPPPPYVVRHERLHCAGYDNAGSDSMRRMLERRPDGRGRE